MLTEKEKFCLSGFAATKDADMAYLLSRPKPTEVKDKEILHKMALRWLRKKEVKEYLDEVFAISFNQSKEDAATRNFRKKEDVVAELNQLATSVKEPKLKAEILLKLADLQQMKKEDVAEEQETIHFYLPISCKMCDLYNREKKRKEMERQQDQEQHKS